MILTEDAEGIDQDTAEGHRVSSWCSDWPTVAETHSGDNRSTQTRSGKIMRRLLKDAAEGQTQADHSSHTGRSCSNGRDPVRNAPVALRVVASAITISVMAEAFNSPINRDLPMLISKLA